MNKKMIEEWSTVVSVVSQIVSAGALVALAFVAVMLFKGGSFPSVGGANTDPTAQVPTGAVPEQVTELTNDQWKNLLSKVKTSKGSNNAKVTMVEFTDYQCPFCGRYFTDTYSQIMKNYVDNGKVKYILANLPLSFHPNAHISAEAAECAGDQKKYWEMHDKLFGNQTAWSNDADAKPKFEGYAKEIGLNVDQYKKCIADGKFKQKIDDESALAATVGASGTPTFIINGKLLVGAQPYAEFEKTLNEALKN